MKVKLPNIEGFEFTKLSYNDFVASVSELSSYGWSVEDLGVSSDGVNNIFGLSLGDPNKATIFILGGIHGYNEWRCCYWVRNFAKEVASPSNPELKRIMQDLRSNFHFFIIPCLNPYGYINFTRWNANEVDINRNFDSYWEDFEPEPGWGGKGDFPFSEPEAQVVKSKVEQYKPVLFLDCHSWGGGAGGTMAIGAPDYQQFFRAAFDAIMSMRYSIDTEHTLYYGQPSSRPLAAVWATSQTSQWGIEPLSAVCESGFQQPIFEEAYIGMNQLLGFCYKVLDYKTKRQVIY